jgi:hypothetical protein
MYKHYRKNGELVVDKSDLKKYEGDTESVWFYTDDIIKLCDCTIQVLTCEEAETFLKQKHVTKNC